MAQITPKPIPPGYGFPTPKAVIDHWVDTSDTAKMREHAWNLWAGMAADSGQSYDGQPLPIWETWYGTEEIFPATGTGGVATAAALLKPDRAPPRAFISPNQFRHLARLKGLAAAANGPADVQVVSFNKFDPAAADFIVAPHAGPQDAVYFYNTQSGLNALNAAWPAGATGEKRGVDDFPDRAIETKRSWASSRRPGSRPSRSGRAWRDRPTRPIRRPPPGRPACSSTRRARVGCVRPRRRRLPQPIR